MTHSIVIAIDGPGASGKSTLAKALAKRLNFDYLDTGAMYRALAWKVLQNKVNFKDTKQIVQLCERQRIEFKKSGWKLMVFINKENVTNKIRSFNISEAASRLSEIGGLRRIMKETQRRISKGKRIILEGRDIGTVVFPRADCKIFLEASLEERTKRRFKEFLDRSEKIKKETLRRELIKRDKRDSSRKSAPLRKAGDAVLLDSTDLSIARMTEKALRIIAQKIRLDVL